MFFLFVSFSDEPEVVLSKHSKSNTLCCSLPEGSKVCSYILLKDRHQWSVTISEKGRFLSSGLNKVEGQTIHQKMPDLFLIQ